jgi:HEAT repeat protein
MHLHIIKKRSSPFFLFPFTLLLTLFRALPWVSPKEQPKPKQEAWQINGIVAALDDGYDGVKKLALEKFNEYDPKNLKSVVHKPEDIAEKVLKILKDNTVDLNICRSAAEALENLGEAAKSVKNILQEVKDQTVDLNVRRSAAQGLGNLGEAAKPYVQDIADIFKNKTLDPSVRSSAAVALGKIEQLDLNNVLLILDSIYYAGQSEFEQWRWRFLTYFLGGGTDEIKTLLTWLGFPNTKTIPAQLSHEQGNKTLKIFAQAWEPSRDLARLREDLAKQIAVVAKKVSW